MLPLASLKLKRDKQTWSNPNRSQLIRSARDSNQSPKCLGPPLGWVWLTMCTGTTWTCYVAKFMKTSGVEARIEPYNRLQLIHPHGQWQSKYDYNDVSNLTKSTISQLFNQKARLAYFCTDGAFYQSIKILSKKCNLVLSPLADRGFQPPSYSIHFLSAHGVAWVTGSLS